MRRYAEEHDIMTTPRHMLVGSFHGDKILLAMPLLRWYLEHGLEVTRVYQVVEYTPIPCFRQFDDAVSTARRQGDVNPHKAIIADTMTLLGNSGYGKTITNVDRLSKRHNEINKDAFLDVLANRRSGSGKNRGFRVHLSSVLTYVQEREALTYFYAKRVVYEDGVSTGPVDVYKKKTMHVGCTAC